MLSPRRASTTLFAALRDQVFPALRASSPAPDPVDALRLLLWIAARQMAAARHLPYEVAPPAASPALDAAASQVESLPWQAADPCLLGDLYASLQDQRRASGRYFTPRPLADQVVRWVLAPHEDTLLSSFTSPPSHAATREGEVAGGDHISLLDPAMGSGHFLIAAARHIAGEGADASTRWAALHHLYGADSDPFAVELARTSLWLWAALPGTSPAGLADRLRCGDSLRADMWADRPSGFDAVVGNPPYASVFTRARSEAGAPLEGRFASASGSFDLAVPFVERSISLLREGGRCGLVLPNKLLAADYAGGLRRWLADRAVVEVIADLSAADVFDAEVYPVVCVFRREAPAPTDPIRIVRIESAQPDSRPSERRAPALIRIGTQSDLRGAPGDVWSAAADPAFEALRSCWQGNVIPLGEVATLAAGLTVGEAYDLRDSVIEAPPNWMPGQFYQLTTTGLIRRYRSAWGQIRATYLKRTLRRPVIAGHALPPRRLAQSSQPKIVLAGMGREPRALVDRGLVQASVSTLVLTDPAWPLDALCALLNASLVARLYRVLFGGLALGGGYLRFGKRELARLPVPGVPAGDPRVVRLAALGARAASGDEWSAAIDALVCDLYAVDPADLPT